MAAIVFVRGEPITEREREWRAHPWKIPGWIVLVCENIFENKRAYRK